MKTNLKKFSLFSLVLVTIAAVTVVAGCQAKRSTETTQFVDQGEVGNYYYYLESGNLSMTLSENKVTFNNGSSTLTGTYTFDGTNLVVKFDGDTSGVNVNYATDSLSFTYKGTTYTLYRDVNYQVVFSTGDGSKVASESVVNGKAASTPAAPSLDGYTFVGWYQDEACTKAYDWSTLVTENVTLYARFVENTDPAKEFTVNFVTGVDGVEFDAVTTLGNTVYNLPEVNASGKEFAGWWVSDYEDPERLTYQFESGMELYADTTLYAVYASSTPLVSVAEGRIVWDSKGVNKTYAVNILSADYDTDAIYSKSTSTTAVNYDFNNEPAGNYVIEVTSGNYTGRAYLNNKGLDRVSKISFDGYTVSWNAVENATNYEITIKCGLDSHNHTNLDLGDVTSYDFSSCVMPSGGIDFTITAQGEGYGDSVSKTVNLYRELEQVKNYAVNDEQQLTWDAVEGATSYRVQVADKNGQVNSYTVTTNSFDLSSYYDEMNIMVTPVCQGYYAVSSLYTYTKTVLSVPENITLTGYTVSWDKVEGAVSYNIVIGDKTYTSETNSLEIPAADIDDVESFTVKVQAVASNASNNSVYSKLVEVSKAGITQITYANGIISWNGVAGVTKYAVEIDDEAEMYVSGANRLAYTVSSGDRTIKVAPCDAEGNHGSFFEYRVQVYALTLDKLDGNDPIELYYVKGDTISLPTVTFKGYNFVNWYTTDALEDVFTGTIFDYDKDFTIYAAWTGIDVKANFDLTAYGILEETSQIMTFGSKFTLPVPESNSNLKVFGGWYAEPNGKGEQYTDQDGNSVGKWMTYNEVTLYAQWINVFTFTLVNDGKAYSVTPGDGINYVTTMKVPAVYNKLDADGNPVLDEDGNEVMLPVTTVDGFQSRTKLKTVYLPSTIQIVETGSKGPNQTGSCFQGCTGITGIYVYEVSEEENIEKLDQVYDAVNGVLLHYSSSIDTTGWEIAWVPYYTINGAYTIPEIVQYVPANAFKGCTKLTEIIVPATVKSIAESAFESCTALTKITFLSYSDEEVEAGKKNEPLTISANAFKSCSSIVEIDLPARLKNLSVAAFIGCLDLEAVNVTGTYEDAVYASLDGVLLNAEKTAILFYPQAKEGEYRTPVGVTTIKTGAFNAAGYYKALEKAKDSSLTLTSSEITTLWSANAVDKLTALIISPQVTTIEDYAVSRVTALKTLTFEGTATDMPLTIGYEAFYYCSGLTEVNFPANLYEIDEYAFGYTSKLTTVSVSSDMADINFENNAFGSETTTNTPTFYVTTLTIGKTVPEFAVTGVFGQKLNTVTVEEGNTSFTSIDGVLYNAAVTSILYYPAEKEGSFTLPDTITTIGARVFQSKTGITSITINKNVTLIGEGAFASCSNLASVYFEEGGTADLTIDMNAFTSCSKLETIVLPERLVYIGDFAFRYDSKIVSINIPDKVTYIGSYSFASCTSLESITLPKGLNLLHEDTSTTVGDKDARVRTFDFDTKLKEINVTEGNDTYLSMDGILYKYMYDSAKGDGTSTATANTYYTYDADEGYKLVDEGTVLAADTVYYQKNGKYELVMCPAAKGGAIDLPANIGQIDSHSFYNNDAVTSITFSHGAASGLIIGSYSFYSCGLLESIELPVGCKEIDMYAFYSDSVLTSVTVPYTVEYIQIRAFYYLSALTSIIFAETPEGVEAVNLEFQDPYATTSTATTPTYYGICYSCAKLESLELPERLTHLGAYAFYNLTGLKSVVIPSTITELENRTFYGCTGLTSVTFRKNAEGKSSIKSIGTYCFYNCNKITSYDLPEGIETIEDYAFYDAYALTSLTIPSTVKTIGNYAFAYAKVLNNLTFASGSVVESFGKYAFAYDYLLPSITIPKSLVSIGDYCFSGDKVLATVTFEVDETKGSSLRHIYQYAFTNTGLTEFSFPYCGIETTTADGKVAYNELVLGGSLTTATTTTVALFSGCKKLKSVYLSENITTLEGLFTKCSSIKNVTVSSNSNNFKTDAARPIIYSISGSEIVLVYGEQEGEFIIPEGVTQIGDYAFNNQATLTKVTFPSTLKSIGTYAFANCTNLESVEFAEGCLLSEIGSYAFINNYSLKSIKFPNYLTTVPSYCFAHCYNLSEIKLNKVKTVETYAFMNTAIESISFPSDMEAVKSYSFAYCDKLQYVSFQNDLVVGTYSFAYDTALTTIDFGSKMTCTDGYVFAYDTALKDVTFPASMYYLATGMFKGCEALESITIPKTVLYIGTPTFNKTTGALTNTAATATYTFMDCTNLKSVTFEDPTTCLYIGGSTFYGCSSLTDIELPANLTFIPSAMFQDCTSLESIVIPDNVTQIGSSYSTGSCFKGCTSLKSITFGAGLQSIFGYAFQNCTALETLVIPETVTALGNYAFSGCTGLKSVTFEGNITNFTTSVATYAFMGDTALTTVDLGSKMSILGYYMFKDCTALESITLPESLKSILGYTFQNCTALKEITTPASCTNIGTYSFRGCTSLEKATVNGVVTTWGTYIFGDCTSLKECTVNDANTKTGSYMFYNDSSLESFTFPSKLAATGIGTYMFYNATGLKECTIPTATTIPGYMFYNCTGLETVSAPKATTINYGAFRGCTSLKNVNLPEAQTVSYYTFFGCTSLETLSLPKLKSISYYAFACSGLTSFEIPSSVTSISYCMFNGCENLTTVTNNSSACSVYNNMAIINSSGQVCSVYNVPENYVIPEGTTFANYALAYAKLGTVTLPESLATLPTYLFEYSSVKKVILGSKVTTIGSLEFAYSDIEEIDFNHAACDIGASVFRDCVNLNKFDNAENVKTIGSYAFSGAGMTSFELFENVTSISTYAFQNNTALQSFTFNDKCESVGTYAFAGSGLVSITVPANIATPGTYMFQNCLSLETVVYAASAIPSYCFNGCTALKNLTLEEGVETIGSYSFKNCNLIERVDFPESLIMIAATDSTSAVSSAFIDCTSLKTITFKGNNLTNIAANTFNGCTALEEFIAPAGLLYIGQYAFAGCTSLKKVVLNEGLETLGSVNTTPGTTNTIGRVFQGDTNLEEINIPSTLANIGSLTFDGCTKIKSITLSENCVYVGGQAFCGWTADQTINIVSSKYEITGSWYDSQSTGAALGWWSDCNAVINWNYVEPTEA